MKERPLSQSHAERADYPPKVTVSMNQAKGPRNRNRDKERQGRVPALTSKTQLNTQLQERLGALGLVTMHQQLSSVIGGSCCHS